MAIRLLVADTDENYLERLVAIFTKKEPDGFDISISSNQSHLERVLSTTAFDILLMNPNIYINSLSLQNATYVFLLLDDKNYDTNAPVLSGYVGIYKYQRVTYILEVMLRLYAESPRHVPLRYEHDVPYIFSSSKIKIYTILQASGGCGATTVAMAIAKRLAGSGKRVLYLNFEYSSSTYIMFPDSGNGMTEIFETVRRGLHIADKLEQFVKRDSNTEVMYLPEVDYLEDLSPVTGNDMRCIINEVADFNKYDAVVIDTGGFVDKRSFPLLELSDFIYLLIGNSDVSIHKAQRCISKSGLVARFRSKIGIIYNRIKDAKETTDAESLSLDVVARIPEFSRSSFRDVVEAINDAGCLDFTG